jgi:hypothetical protein
MVGLSRVPQRQLLNEARNDSHEVAAATEVTDVYPDSQEAWSSTRHPLLVSPTTPNGSCAHRREPARENSIALGTSGARVRGRCSAELGVDQSENHAAIPVTRPLRVKMLKTGKSVSWN